MKDAQSVFTRALLAVLMVAGMTLLMGQAGPKRTVEAESFVLVDDHGNQRAWLGLEKDGAFLTLKDSAGNRRIRLGVESDVSSIHLFDSRGVHRAAFEVSLQEQGIIYMDEETREERMLMGEEPSLSLYDKYGVERVAADIKGNRSTVATYDSQGEFSDGIGLTVRLVPLKPGSSD